MREPSKMNDPLKTAENETAMPAGWDAADETMLDRAAKHAMAFRRSLAVWRPLSRRDTSAGSWRAQGGCPRWALGQAVSQAMRATCLVGSRSLRP